MEKNVQADSLVNVIEYHSSKKKKRFRDPETSAS
jgi:hypothetical protein